MLGKQQPRVLVIAVQVEPPVAVQSVRQAGRYRQTELMVRSTRRWAVLIRPELLVRLVVLVVVCSMAGLLRFRRRIPATTTAAVTTIRVAPASIGVLRRAAVPARTA